MSSQSATPVIELVGNRRVCHVELANFVLETLDNSRVAGGIEGARRVPGDAAQAVQQVPLVAESWVHPSLFSIYMSATLLFLKHHVSTDLCGEIAQRRSRRRVGVLQRQSVVRPRQHQKIGAGSDSGVVEDESALRGGEAVVQAHSRRIHARVLVEKSLVAALDESDHSEDAGEGAAGLDGANGAVGGGGLESDGGERVDEVRCAGGVDDGELGAGGGD